MNVSNLQINPSHINLIFIPKHSCLLRQSRLCRRRRIKRSATRNLTLNSNLLDPFQNFVSQFPSSNNLDFLAPVLGFASGITLYLSQFKSSKSSSTSDIGEWILFSSPTPCNRFVFLRCPSISFEGGEFLEDVNDRLVEEERHFVKLNSGRIQVRDDGGGGLEKLLEYQRVCVTTDDGGVISLDWPANLNLREEHGLDTTLLLVPGTAQGSMGENVRSLVCESLTRGFFPIVMNPRGCAGSPLTTARLFTAADSDDIFTAVQFINKARPWTSLMGVGWGYGANMLTKYLAEIGERTPLMAATCINNPFDLEEATRSSPYHIALDQKLTGGLIDILKANKELFQGRAKGFNVERALMAKSVREFEQAISMVSYGFEEIKDFYSKSSTRPMVGKVKIPVLFIQNDDGTVPLFSIPRTLIAENPSTSLLVCSCVSSSINASGRAAVSWCQSLTIEWLSAVELGLLKGRHPLLKDVDVSFNPAKGLTLVEGRTSGQGIKIDKFLGATATDAKGILEDKNTSIQYTSRQDSHQGLEFEEHMQMENGSVKQNSSSGAELIGEEEADPVDIERGEVLQTAQVVMNMLDVTIPGVLEEEEKKKVLTAVGQGETLMKALEGAVPEDVREKLKSAASGILRTQHTNLKLDRLLGMDKIPAVSSGIKSNTQEKGREAPTAEAIPRDPHSSDGAKKEDDVVDVSFSGQPGSDKPAAALEPELSSTENLHNPSESGQLQIIISQQDDTDISSKKRINESGNSHERDGLVKEKSASSSNSGEKGLETSGKQSVTSHTEKASSSEEAIVDERKVDQDSGRETNNQKNEEKKTPNALTDQNKTESGNVAEEATSPAGPSPDSQLVDRDGCENHTRDSKPSQPTSNNSKPTESDSNHSTFSVAQALDAFTGMDDSTQVAVNSVFGVIEEMITQLEEGKDDENKYHNDEVKDESLDSTPKKEHAVDDHLSKTDENNDLNVQPSTPQYYSVHKHIVKDVNSQDVVNNGWEEEPAGKDVNSQGVVNNGWEEEPTENSVLYDETGTNGSQGNVSSKYNDGTMKAQLVGSKYSADRHVNSIPPYKTANPYGNYLENKNLRSNLLSKLPNGKSLDVDTTTGLLLDYFPEEGQWKLLEQPRNVGEIFQGVSGHNGVNRSDQIHSHEDTNYPDNYIEPSYVVLDTEKQHEPVEGYNRVDKLNFGNTDHGLEEVMKFVKSIILDALRVEIGRKLSTDGMKEMESDFARDLEQVANAVSLAIRQDKSTLCLQGKNFSIEHTSEKVGTLQGEHIVGAISSAVLDTTYLRRMLPVGVVIGSSLAALRKYFDVGTRYDDGLTFCEQTEISGETHLDKSSIKEGDLKLTNRTDQNSRMTAARGEEGEVSELKYTNKDSVMVGAVTAALGASALLVQQQNPYQGKETAEDSLSSEQATHAKAVDKVDGAISEKNQNSIVASLAEKAMSVAGPVVPMKEDGEVDQERLVAMLAELGQKGGLLRLVGKVALLWGGIRGAMSLTDRLISFLHMAECPLYKRIIGFFGMVLVLWSPVIVPLLPTLVQSWTTSKPSRFAEIVSITGFYTAVMILVVLWGRRIRGYKDPLEEYGLDLAKPSKIQNFLLGSIGGVMLVLSIHSGNALLGLASISLPSSHPVASSDAIALLKTCGQVIMLVGRGIITATSVAIVEELVFRSWLPEEIAIDFGYHQGIIISGLAFSISQRSLWAIPGLWLLSLALAGFRQRSRGSLSFPIGLRTGIMTSSFILQTSGLLTYTSNYPQWVTGTHPFQPFSGIVGIVFSSLLAIILYPRQHLEKSEKTE